MKRIVALVFSVIAFSAVAGSATPADPYRNFRFQVTIDGKTAMAFMDVAGFDVSSNVVEYREGTAVTPRKLPGIQKYSNIVLKKGFIDPALASAWVNSAAAGKAVQKNITINLMDEEGKVVSSWTVSNGTVLKNGNT